MAVRTARAAIEKLRFNPDQLEQIVDVVQADLIQSTLLFDIPQAANFDNNPIQTEAKDSRAVAVAKSR